MQVPAYAWFLSGLAGLILSWWAYRFLWSKHPLWKLAAVLRGLSIALVVLWIFNPYLHFNKNETRPARWDVYFDASASTGSDQKNAALFLDSLEQEFSNVSFRRFAFAETVVPFANRATLGGNSTRLDPVFAHMQAQKAQTDLRLFLSDGIVNQGRALESWESSELGPIASLGLGDTTAYTDLSIQEVLANLDVYQGNETEVEGTVEAVAAKGRLLNIECWVNGVRLFNETWMPLSNRQQKKLSFTLNTNQIKSDLLDVSIRVLPLLGEKNVVNNRKSALIQVRDAQKTIDLIYGGVHPDIKAIQLALLGKEAYKIRAYPESEGLKLGADLYIAHGLKSAVTLAAIKKKALPTWWFAFNNETIQVLFTGREAQLMRRGLNGLQEAIPDINSQFSAFELPEAASIYRLWTAVESPLLAFKVGIDEVQLFQNWGGSKTEVPLMFTRVEKPLESIFMGAGIWRWRMNESRKLGESPLFDAWVTRNVQRMSREANGKKGWEFVSPEGFMAVGEKRKIKWIYYDDAGEKQVKSGMDAFLKEPGSEPRKLPIFSENGELVSYLNATKAGVSRVWLQEASGVQWGKSAVSVSENNLELSQSRAQHQELAKLANKTGGVFGDFRSQAREWASQVKKLGLDSGRIVKIERYIPFEEWIWVFVLLSIFLSTEWFLRKWLGKI